MIRERFSRIASVLLILCFVGFTGLAMIRTTVRDKDTVSFYENRNLATLPTLTVESALDGSYFSAIDKYVSDHSVARKAVLAAKTALDMYVLHRPVVNDVVITDGLLLPFNRYEVIDETAIAENADAVAQNLASHAAKTASYGGAFYYIAVPCQYVCYEQAYPQYLNNRSDYTALSSAALFERLDALGVSYIDMREHYEENGRPASFTSTVDNHYSIFGAYDTYAALLDRIGRDTDFRPHILTLDDFTATALDYGYLGSRTRKLFGLWESEERLYTLTPKAEIPFELWSYGTKADSPTVYSMEVDGKGRIHYGLYMGGDIAETVIETDREHLPSIFIYGDSFTNAFECVAYTGFDTTWAVDYRYYEGLSVDQFIDTYKPDIVVCIRDYEAMLAPYQNGQ